jgi:ATP-dependent exoDNAse (exonuclease V) beta subunit
VRREELIVKDVPRDVMADGQRAYDQWRLARDGARTTGSKPSLVVSTVRAWVATEEDSREVPASAVTVVDVAGRPRDSTLGAAFGALVHAILAEVPLGATRGVVERVAGVQAQLLGAPPEALSPAVAAVEQVLAHPLINRAQQAEARGACRRETPVTCVLSDGTLLEGVADIAFEDEGGWTVIDYNTDRDLSEMDTEQYRRQVAVYATAIAYATKCPASAVLLRV